jgi:hypothetical protein
VASHDINRPRGSSAVLIIQDNVVADAAPLLTRILGARSALGRKPSYAQFLPGEVQFLSFSKTQQVERIDRSARHRSRAISTPSVSSGLDVP